MRTLSVTLFVLLSAVPTFADGAGAMANSGAPIVFFDIAGPDAAKLKEFYASNFGWDIAPWNMIQTPQLPGTLRQDPPEKILYIGVTDLDAAMASVKASGGTIETPKLPTPTGEQFVLFKDPAGNRMGLVGIKK
jgi:predicted enzyme related to lactoylglutathione lyase